VKQVRIPTLLLVAMALLVVWYLTGGRNEIAWHEYVRNAKAQGWDLSQADRWPHYGILYYLSAYRMEFSFFWWCREFEELACS